MYAENLLNLTQNFLAPDIVNRFSSAIGETTEKTQKGLKSIIPALLLGIVKKGQTKAGAETLVNLVNKDGVEGEAIPNVGDTSYLTKGDDAVQGIFGNELGQVLNNLGDTTGINVAGVSKVLGMAAPMVMGSLGEKMKKEKMSASGLMGFLGQQRSSISKLVPEGLVGRIPGAGLSKEKKTSTVNVRRGTQGVTKESRDISWSALGVVALALIAAFWWFTGRKNFTTLTSPTADLVTSPLEKAEDAVEATPRPLPGIEELDNFVETGSISAPSIFRFQTLNFDANSSVLLAGAETELDEVARVMKENPGMAISLNGHTDNTVSGPMSIELSNRMAMAVKEQLVVRGIEAFRIQTMGLGSDSPMASNNTEEGRVLNRRVEIEVLQIK